MTNEETDDNDRMNRADRLREMREGRRRGRSGSESSESSESSDDESATAESADAEEGTTADDDPVDGAEPTGTDESPVTDDATDDSDPTADETPSIEESADEPDDTATDPAPATEADPDAEENGAVEESGFEFDEKEAAHDEKAEKTGVEAGGDDPSTEPQSGVAQTVSSTDAASAIEGLNGGSTFAIPDQATTVTEADEQTTLEGAEQSVAAARAAAASRGTTHVGARTRVLEFELGSERFCLDIDYIEEIVELENMTRVPNSPSYVEGVVDLRGQVTTIINPKDALEVDNEGEGDLIIVFDSEEVGDQGHLGWVVDEVRQVTPVSDDEVNESPDEDAEHINGIINREDEDDFVVWTTPELALNSS